MLTVTPIVSPQAKADRLFQVDFTKSTWIVSDLKSKLEIQKRRLKLNSALAEESILRINELWRAQLSEHFPTWQIVSTDFVRTLIQNEIESLKLNWMNGANAGHRMLQMMNQFIPLLVMPADDNLVQEWLVENPASRIRWGHWFELSRVLWNALLSQQVLPTQWLPGFLLSHDVEMKWPRDLVIDLNSQMSQIEAQLLVKISANSSVEVLIPAANWQGSFDRTLEPYEHFGKSQFKFQPSLTDFQLEPRPETRHFTTSLAEVKDAVGQVRKWLDAGVAPAKIVVVAPQIEPYWSLLGPSLFEEGVPALKSRQRPIHSFKPVQLWLARLRLKLGQVKPEDLEIASFAEGNSTISVEEFRRLFTHFYGREQINLHSKLADKFKSDWNAADLISRDDFIWQALTLWPTNQTEKLESILQKLLSDGRGATRLPGKHWLSWLESWLAKIEVTVVEAQLGVECLNLSAVEWVNASHVYFLGMSEDELTGQISEGLSASEVEQLRRDLGLAIPRVEQSHLEFEGRWALSKSWTEAILSCPKVDVEGGPVAPSRLWLLQNEKLRERISKFDLPLKTRWDELQKSDLSVMAKAREWTPGHFEKLRRGLDEDFGVTAPGQIVVRKKKGVSASSLEAFSECPFVFAATRYFLLQDLPSLDLDLSPMANGQLIHKIFEKLTIEPMRFDFTELELALIVEKAREEEKVFDLGLWPKFKTKLMESARRFLEFERSWRNLYPETYTIAREISFDVGWSTELKSLISKDQIKDSDFQIRGRVDRVDSDKKGHYVVIDYKSSGYDLVGAETWLSRDAFQLAIYQKVVALGMTELPAGEVQGAFYFIINEMKRTKGIHIKEESAILPIKGAPKTSVSRERAEEIWSLLSDKITQILRLIEIGELAPKPKKIEICQSCSWRQLCRAPHLQ